MEATKPKEPDSTLVNPNENPSNDNSVPTLASRDELTLSNIKQNGYYFVRHQEGLSDEDKDSIIETLNYVEKIALEAGISIYRWNPWQVWGLEDGSKKLVTHTGEINRRLFGHYRANRPAIPESRATMLKWREQINAGYSLVVRRKLESLKASRRRARQDAMRYYNQHVEKLKSVHEYAIQIEQFKGSDNGKIDLFPKIEAICSSFWQFFQVADNDIDFITSQDVVIKEINPRAGINCVVNLGRLRARLDPVAGTLMVLRFKNNLNAYDDENECSMGYYHPHISEGGRICWGNVSDQAMRLLSDLKYAEVFQLLASLLMNYNTDNPYCIIQAFENAEDYDNWFDDAEDIQWDFVNNDFVFDIDAYGKFCGYDEDAPR